MSMRVLDWSDFAAGTAPEPAAMTVGVFDGVHRGHQALIERIVRRGPFPTVVTFKENPKKMTRPRGFEGDIFSLGQKLRVFEELGVARTILIDFSENFSKIKGPDFLEILRVRGALTFLAVGGNFRCGYRLDTHAADIKKMNERDGISTELVPPVLEAGRPVSSSRVRAAITGGDLAGAAALLGRKLTLDLEGVPAGNRDGGAVFDMPSRNRITPPDGRYPAVLYGADAPAGVRAEISLERGRVFVPALFNAERIEFV